MAKTRAQRKAERRRREAAGKAPGEPAPGERPVEDRKDERPTAAEGGQARMAAAAAPEPEMAEAQVAGGEEAAVREAPARVAAVPPSERGDAFVEGAVAEPEEPSPPPRLGWREKRKASKKAAEKPARPEPKAARKPAQAPQERSRVITFLGEVRVELRRVQWPTRPVLMQATAVVIVTVLVFALYFMVWDWLFNNLVHRFL